MAYGTAQHQELVDDVSQLVVAIRRKTSDHSVFTGARRYPSAGSSSCWLIGFIVGSFVSAALAANGDRAVDLSPGQLSVLFLEANDAYREARATSDAGAAASRFAAAAEKYEWIMSAGVQNGRLAFNAGNANLYAGRLGRAVAFFRRALRFEPHNQRFRKQLAEAERLLDDNQQRPSASWYARFRKINQRWIDFVSVSGVRMIFACAWVGLWCVIALGASKRFSAWKLGVVLLLPVAALSAWSYVDVVLDVTDDSGAVFVSDRVVIRQGDDPRMPVVAEIDRAEGRLVDILRWRAGWVQVRSGDVQGWVTRDQLIPIIETPVSGAT
jgi:hypothetical protein